MRSSEEPFNPPVRDVAISQTDWYCYHCGFGFTTAVGAVAHVKASHPWIESPDRGYDYDVGSYVTLARLKRREWEQAQAERFGKHLNSLRGADDFVVEAEIGDA